MLLASGLIAIALGAPFEVTGDHGRHHANVAWLGDRLLVGQPYLTSGQQRPGGVVLFTLRGDRWAEGPRWLVGPLHDPGFDVAGSGGRALAATGDLAVVGAERSVTLLRPDGDALVAVEQVTARGVLGLVAADGDTVVFTDDQAGGSSVRTLRRSGEGWREAAALPVPSPDAVALRGDRLVVGADFVGATVASEQVRSYRWTADGWRLEAELTQEGPASMTTFGGRLSLDGDTLAVAASWRTPDFSSARAVFLYRWSDGAWVRTATLSPPGGAGLVEAMALRGNTLLTYVPGDRLLVWAEGADGWSTVPWDCPAPPEPEALAVSGEVAAIVADGRGVTCPLPRRPG